MDIHGNIHYYATYPLPFPWRFIAFLPPFDLLLTSFSRENKGKTKGIQRENKGNTESFSPTHVPLISHSSPTEVRRRDVFIPSKGRWKGDERVLKGYWTGGKWIKTGYAMNGGQTGKGKLGVWEDMTCDCQQCLFIRALPGRFWKTQRQKEVLSLGKTQKNVVFLACSLTYSYLWPLVEGTFARKNAKKRNFSCFFAHLIVTLRLFLSLALGSAAFTKVKPTERRYSRSEIFEKNCRFLWYFAHLIVPLSPNLTKSTIQQQEMDDYHAENNDL